MQKWSGFSENPVPRCQTTLSPLHSSGPAALPRICHAQSVLWLSPELLTCTVWVSCHTLQVSVPLNPTRVPPRARLQVYVPLDVLRVDVAPQRQIEFPSMSRQTLHLLLGSQCRATTRALLSSTYTSGSKRVPSSREAESASVRRRPGDLRQHNLGEFLRHNLARRCSEHFGDAVWRNRWTPQNKVARQLKQKLQRPVKWLIRRLGERSPKPRLQL